jgi:hypothetical protein
MTERTPGSTIDTIRPLSRISLATMAVGMLALSAHAGTVVVKPGLRGTFAPEFARTLARSSTHTIAASQQETIVKPGEAIFGGGTIGSQGAVYVFNDATDVPERVYQYPGNANFMKSVGSRVAISDNFLAFASAREGDDPRFPQPAAIYVVAKTNGQWPQCPTVGGVLDCTPVTGAFNVFPQQPIVRIPLQRNLHWTEISLAVSNNTLAIADNKQSQVWIYRYNATNKTWNQEYFLDDLDDRHFGAGLAIDGDMVAVSSSFSNGYDAGQEPGYVRILKRSTSGGWSFSSMSYGSFSTGNFGYKLAFNAGSLAVLGGTTSRILATYRVGTDGVLSTPVVTAMPSKPVQIAMSGNTLAVSFEDTIRTLGLYTRNTSGAGTTWTPSKSLDGRLYASQNFYGYGYPGADEIGLAGDKLSLGWRGFGIDAQNSLIGAFVREKVSEIDACKTPGNLVQNCSFDIPTSTAWSFLTWNGASGYPNYTGGEMANTIYWGGSDFWHVQARTKVVVPASGAYTLKFRARSTGSRSLIVNLGHNGSQDNNWTSYARFTTTLGNTMQEYSFEMPWVPADANAALDFNMGNAGTLPVILDGVSVTRKP